MERIVKCKLDCCDTRAFECDEENCKTQMLCCKCPSGTPELPKVECPNCGAIADMGELFEVETFPETSLQKIYNKIAGIINDFILFLRDVLSGGVYCSKWPKIINKITGRSRFRVPYKIVDKLLPTLPYWRLKYFDHFIWICKKCGMKYLDPDPYTFLTFDYKKEECVENEGRL